MGSIRTKRIFEVPDVNDGIRILVDRLWPRGIKKESAAINAREKECHEQIKRTKKIH